MTDLTEEGGIGVVAAFIEAAVLQPTVYWKNAKAQNLPFSMDPKVLYRGSGATIFNECQTLGLQFATTAMFKKYLGLGEDNIASAFGGGALTALFAAPVEHVMIQQQVQGGSAISAVSRICARSQGVFTLWRGLSLCVVRDSIYVGAMLGLTPKLKKHFEKAFGMSSIESNFYASMVGGVVAAVPSHPFDMMKTCINGYLEPGCYRGVIGTYRYIVEQNGHRRLFNGVMWRTINITATVWIVNEISFRIKSHLHPHPPSSH